MTIAVGAAKRWVHTLCIALVHEYFAQRAGLAEQKIASIVAGERPDDLTHDERVAYDMAAALNRGGPLPETTYRAVLSTFGEQALAEIVFLVGCFSMVGVALNAFDASVPGREEGLDKERSERSLFARKSVGRKIASTHYLC
jgi:hypothetical protein